MHREEKRLQALYRYNILDTDIQSLPVNFFMYDEQGNPVRWNRKLRETTG